MNALIMRSRSTTSALLFIGLICILSTILPIHAIDGYLPEFMQNDCHFFSPYEAYRKNHEKHHTLVPPPEIWIEEITETYTYLDAIIPNPEDLKQRAINTYLAYLSNLLVGVSFGSSERSVSPKASVELLPFERERRSTGLEWPYLGVSMVGLKRMENLQLLVSDIIKNKVPGSLLEAGVWRGGASIFMEAVLKAHGIRNKLVILADSFHGLPKGNNKLHKNDVGWDKLTYLQVSDQRVAIHFHKFNLLAKNIYFLKGFFNNTMPPLSNYLTTQSTKITELGYEKGLALLRMDGDLYQSTVDILYNLYEHVSVGGYVIVDDWTGYPAKDACLDFFAVHKINPTIITIDQTSVYWKKTEQITVQSWRYQKNDYRPSPVN